MIFLLMSKVAMFIVFICELVRNGYKSGSSYFF